MKAVGLQPEAEAGGEKSAACRPNSTPCGPTHGDEDTLDVCL